MEVPGTGARNAFSRTPEALLVLATGSGKSLQFMLGSSLPGARTTIVIVPLVLLRLDLLRRCKDLGLSPIVWSNTVTRPSYEPREALPTVTAQWARRFSRTRWVDRLECDLGFNLSHYRL